MQIAVGCFALALLIFAMDLGLAHLQGYLKRRAKFKRNAQLIRYGMTSFRGTKDRFLS